MFALFRVFCYIKVCTGVDKRFDSLDLVELITAGQDMVQISTVVDVDDMLAFEKIEGGACESPHGDGVLAENACNWSDDGLHFFFVKKIIYYIRIIIL